MAIAGSFKLSSTKVLTAKSVNEIDELLVEMKKLFEENSRYSADVSIQWERIPDEDIAEIHVIKFKSLQDFEKLVRMIHGNEENFINYLFSATFKLKLEKKDKEAERALKEKEMDFFQPMTPIEMLEKGEKLLNESFEIQNKIMEVQEFEKMTFTHRQDGVEGETGVGKMSEEFDPILKWIYDTLDGGDLINIYETFVLDYGFFVTPIEIAIKYECWDIKEFAKIT